MMVTNREREKKKNNNDNKEDDGFNDKNFEDNSNGTECDY